MESAAQICNALLRKIEERQGIRNKEKRISLNCGHEVGIIERRQSDGSWLESEVKCTHCEDHHNGKEAVVGFDDMQKRKAADKLALYSTLNDDQKAATFENYEPENESQKEARTAAKALCDTIIAEKTKPKGILYGGSFGIGKSHLAAAACNYITQHGKSAAFVSISQLKRKITSTFNNGSKITADEIMDYLKGVDLLVIDDIGQNAQSEFVDETLFDLLESRQGKAHIFTTNLSGRDLIDALAPRIYERVKKGSLPRKLEGESHRRFSLDAEWDF